MYNTMTVVNTAVIDIRKLLRLNPEFSLQGEKFFSFFPFFLFFSLYLYEKMGVTRTYSGDHFTIYVNQPIMLYFLNLYGAACQLFLNKTARKKKPAKVWPQLGYGEVAPGQPPSWQQVTGGQQGAEFQR